MVVSVLVWALIGAIPGRAGGQGAHAPAAERFILNGVIVFEDGSGLAWLREQSLTGDRPLTMRVGESIGAYRLTKILEDRVELEGPAGTVSVPVYNAQAGPGTAVASAAPGAVGGAAPIPAQSPGAAAGPAGSPIPWSVSQQPDAVVRAMTPQADAGARKALHERLEMSRRAIEQSEGEPARAGQRAPGQARAQEPAAKAPSGENPDVVYPAKRQTFQSILGLN